MTSKTSEAVEAVEAAAGPAVVHLQAQTCAGRQV